MKTLVSSFVSIFLVLPSLASTIDEPLEYTGNAAAIEARKQEMMTAVEDTDLYLTDLEGNSIEVYDPHAYWLASRIINMYGMVHSSDDCWAWMLACDDFVEEYNCRLGRRIGSSESAVIAAKEVVNMTDTGGSIGMNNAYYCLSILSLYDTVHDYHELIGRMGNSRSLLQQYYYYDFQIWYELMEAQYDLMKNYTYGAAWYTTLPTTWALDYKFWVEQRQKGLEEEMVVLNIWIDYDFVADADRVSYRKFDNLLTKISNMTCRDVAKYLTRNFFHKDEYESTYDRVRSCYDFDKIDEIVDRYDSLLVCWLQLREQIADEMPDDKKSSYHEITEQIKAQFYSDLYESSLPSL